MRKMVLMKICFLTMIIVWLASISKIEAFPASFKWDPNTESDLAGYKLYYKPDSPDVPFHGTGATEGSSPVDVGNVTTATINGLDDGHFYYFAVTAYNTSGQESAYSNILIAGSPTATSYTITPVVNGCGVVFPSGSQEYPAGSQPSFTINPNNDCQISNVVGCGGTLTGNTYYIPAIQASCNVLATFTPIATYALNIIKTGTGSGIVSSLDAKIYCGSDCTESYVSGTIVTLTTSPSAGSSFFGWTGACSGTESCTVAMSAVRNVNAAFTSLAKQAYRFVYIPGLPIPLVGEHFYTANENEKSSLIANASTTWRYEFPVFYVYATAQPGTVPVYRFVNLQNGQHFYTAVEAEKSSLIANASTTWRYEFPVFYTPTQ